MKTLKNIFLICLVIILVSCSTDKSNFLDLMPSDTSNKVSSKVKEIKNNVITYELQNNKDLSYTFSDFYIIYRYNNDKWEEITENQNFERIIFKLKPSEYKELKLNLPENFSKNYKGIIRIRKPFVYNEKNEMENTDMIFEIR